MRVGLDGVGFRIQRAELVRDVTITISDGTQTAIIGPNGAGKSTLLHLLAGDVSPSTGTVSYGDEPLTGIDVARRARLRALLPQRHTQDVSFTVEQVVHMGRFPYRFDTDARPGSNEQAVAGAIELLDLDELRSRPVRSLSGGELQRVAIARVLAQRAPLVLLDEPTTALDIAHEASVMSVISGLQHGGHTVVAVLHDLDLAAYFDNVVLLEHGSIAAAGSPAEVLTSDTLSAVYRHPIDVVDDTSDHRLRVVPRRIRPTHPDQNMPNR